MVETPLNSNNHPADELEIEQTPKPEDVVPRPSAEFPKYFPPVTGDEQVEETGAALRRLFISLRNDPLTKDLAEWAQHFYDDRVTRAWNTYKDTLQYESEHQDSQDESHQESVGQSRTIRLEQIQKQLDELKAEHAGLPGEIKKAEEKLDSLREKVSQSSAAVGVTVQFPDPVSTEEIAAAQEQHQEKAKWRRFLGGFWAFITARREGRTPQLSQEQIGTDQSSQTIKQVMPDGVRKVRIPKVTVLPSSVLGNLPVMPEEAADELGIPYYVGCEITEEHLEGMKDVMKRGKFEALKLWMHVNVDRRWYSPLIRQGHGISLPLQKEEPQERGKRRWFQNLFGITTFGLIFGLFVGVSLGFSLGWLTPENVQPSLQSALNPVRWFTDLFSTLKGLAGVNTETLGDQVAAARQPVSGVLIFALWAMGYAVAYVSRYAVMIGFLTTGEQTAEFRLKENKGGIHKWWAPALPWVLPIILLVVIAGSEIYMESKSFGRIAMAQDLAAFRENPDGYRQHLEDQRASGIEESVDPSKEDNDLKKQGAWAAACLVLAGYLIYGAGEGFLRGRDNRYRSAILRKMSEMTMERLKAAGISEEVIKKALYDMSLYDAQRSYINGLYQDNWQVKQKIDELLAEMSNLPLAKPTPPVVHTRPIESERVKQAFADFLGANVEFNKLIDELLTLKRRDLESELAAKDADQALQDLIAEERKSMLKIAHSDAAALRLQIRSMVQYILDAFIAEIKRDIDLLKSRRLGIAQKIKLFFSNPAKVQQRSLDDLANEFEKVITRTRKLLHDLNDDILDIKKRTS